MLHVETVILRCWFALFFIEHNTRRVHAADVTSPRTPLERGSADVRVM